MQQKLQWFLESQPSMACAKGGAGAYTDAIQVRAWGLGTLSQSAAVYRGRAARWWSAPLHPYWHLTATVQPCWCRRSHRAGHPQADAHDETGIAGLSDGVVAASSFRTAYVPLSSQDDFISGLTVHILIIDFMMI